MRVVLLCLLVLFSGCAHTLVIEKGAPPERYREAQEFLHSDKPASLFLHTGTKLRATDLYIGPDSTVFRIDAGTDRIVILNERIRSITTQDARKGIRKGAVIGGITGGFLGLVIGGLIASIDYNVNCDSGPEEEDYTWSCTQPKENDAIAVLAGVGTGLLIGSAVGALIGSQSGTMRSVLFYRDPKDPRRWEYLPR